MDIIEEDYLECEKGWVFTTLMFIGGFYGTFTYSIRGGVFCNAQTANFVLCAMALGNGRWSQAAYYLIPMSAYLLGTIVSEAIPNPVKRYYLIRWDTLLILIEMILVVILGFLPESTPYQVSQIIINFICSMQYNTFRQANGIPMATTFCTNHIRQVGVSIVKVLKKHHPSAKIRLWNHVKMILVFVLGGILGVILCRLFVAKAIWFTLIPLGIIFIRLLYADLKKEKGLMDQVPHGH